MYRELKKEVGFEEYLEYVKGTYAMLFFKPCFDTHDLLEELCRQGNRGKSQECPNGGALKELVEHVLFECVSYDFQKQKFFSTLSQIF